jgi:xylose isomerase
VATWRHRYATRLNSFGASVDLTAALKAVAAIPGISAVELNVPEHARGSEEVAAARALGLDVTALNLRYDPRDFRLGAFTNPNPDLRARSIALTAGAVELAAATGIPHVILWMGMDGFDHPFQADYAELWDLEIAGFREIAGRRPEVRVSVEPKPSDPRRVALIRSTSDALLAAREVDRPNFGVTLDFCHSLMAGESPAASAVQALREGRLFGLHLNDGYGPADDGSLVGSVHQAQTLELLWTLRRGGFDGVIYFDTFPERLDPAAECEANIAEVERLEAILDRVDAGRLIDAQRRQDALGAIALVRDAGGA